MGRGWEETRQTLTRTTGVLSQLSANISSAGTSLVQTTGKSRFEVHRGLQEGQCQEPGLSGCVSQQKSQCMDTGGPRHLTLS